MMGVEQQQSPCDYEENVKRIVEKLTQSPHIMSHWINPGMIYLRYFCYVKKVNYNCLNHFLFNIMELGAESILIT